MGRLILVRHGQASFLSDDYDRLSPLGAEQARALAAHWLAESRRFDAVYTGTLRRQAGTAAIVGEAYRAAGMPWPDAEVLPGLDEFPAEELVRFLVPRLLRRDVAIARLYRDYRGATTEGARSYTLFALLEAVTARWVEGGVDTGPLPTWEAFRERVRATLAALTRVHADGDVAAFTSGGVIGVCVHTALQTSPAEAAAAIWRLRNCSLTELLVTAGGIEVACHDAIPHLPRAELVTLR
jgi:broad specificity phosphatase PhoE